MTWKSNSSCVGPSIAGALGHVFITFAAYAQPAWSFRTTSGPIDNTAHCVYDNGRAVSVLVGGLNDGASQIWEWNGTTWSSRAATPGPSARASHDVAFDSVRHMIVLFGGRIGAGISTISNAETWEWNGSAWSQRIVSGPSARYGHAMAHDSARGVTVLFGGITQAGNSAETWEWDGTTWMRRMVSGPPARFSHAMTFDSSRGVTVLFGGYGPGFYADTWEWDGTAWMQRNASGPHMRNDHAMVYDSLRRVTVLFGGYPGTTQSGDNDTWEWNGAEWTQRFFSSSPSTRSGHRMTYDSARHAVIMFGGLTPTGYLHDTWELAANCLCPADFNCDGIADFFDYLDFVAAFSNGSAQADFNHDNTVDFFDYLDFVQSFVTGC